MMSTLLCLVSYVIIAKFPFYFFAFPFCCFVIAFWFFIHLDTSLLNLQYVCSK